MNNNSANQPSNSPAGSAYPAGQEKTARFRGPVQIAFRPIKPEDADLLREFFRSHSAQTILFRYFTPLHELAPEMVRQFVNLDYHNDMAIVGFVSFQERKKMVCVGRYCRNPGDRDAEIAITVHDDFQRHGIGTYLIRELINIARDHGIAGFTADVLAENHGMLRLIRNCAGNIETTFDAGVCHLRFALADAIYPPQKSRKAGC